VRPAARAETTTPHCTQPAAPMPEGLSRCLPGSPKTSQLAHTPSAAGLQRGERILNISSPSPTLPFARHQREMPVTVGNPPAPQHSLDLKSQPPPAERPSLPRGPPSLQPEVGVPSEPTASRLPAHAASLPLVFLTLGISKDRVLVQNRCFSRLEKYCFNYFGMFVSAEGLQVVM